MSAVVPIVIRQHLVPFFFKESEGEEFLYGNKRGKSVLFSSMVSSVGRIMRLLMAKSGKPLNIENFNLYLSISETGNSRQYQGQFYKYESGRNSFLMLPEEANKDINDLLEDIFRTHFISYINGYIENNDKPVIRYVIDKFIDKYDLLEVGISNDMLRKLYYREKKRNKIVARFQAAKSPRVINYLG